jgi:hypothetical protein
MLKYNLREKPYSEISIENERERNKKMRDFWMSEDGKKKESYLYFSCKDNLSENRELQHLTIKELSNYCECYVKSVKTFIRDGNLEQASDQDRERISQYHESCINN